MDPSLSDDWTQAGALEDLPDGKGVQVEVAGLPVLLVRSGGAVFAIGDRCTHQGSRLDRGPVKLAGTLHTVTCPAHGSVFRLEDGAVVRGPAAEPVAAYDARVVDGRVKVRPRG